MVRVAVLMSTYNGEKFISEQVKSILSQRGIDVFLLIRDDGSSDSTHDILQELENTYNNIRVLWGRNMGAPLSFMQLVANTTFDADYYAFADQDDVWMPKKLEKAIEALKESGAYDLYTSNQTLVNADNIYIRSRFDFIPPTDILNIIDKNYFSGCTMVMGKMLFQTIKENMPNANLIKTRMHDTWFAAASACLGKVIYDNHSYINYRQHENNVVGVKQVSLKAKLISKIKTDKVNYHKVFAEELLACFGGSITPEARQILLLYQDTDTVWGKIRFIKSRHFISLYFRSKLQFATKLLFLE